MAALPELTKTVAWGATTLASVKVIKMASGHLDRLLKETQKKQERRKRRR